MISETPAAPSLARRAFSSPWTWGCALLVVSVALYATIGQSFWPLICAIAAGAVLGWAAVAWVGTLPPKRSWTTHALLAIATALLIWLSQSISELEPSQLRTALLAPAFALLPLAVLVWLGLFARLLFRPRG